MKTKSSENEKKNGKKDSTEGIRDIAQEICRGKNNEDSGRIEREDCNFSPWRQMVRNHGRVIEEKIFRTGSKTKTTEKKLEGIKLKLVMLGKFGKIVKLGLK